MFSNKKSLNLKQRLKPKLKTKNSQPSQEFLSSASPRKPKFNKKSTFAASLVLSLALTGIVPANTTHALTKLTAESGTEWEIHDSFAPNLDTGSIRRASSTPAQGFGNIFVQVSTTPEPRMNGQMMRGFGLEFDGKDTFASTRSVNLGDVWIARDIYFDSDNNRIRYFDTFTNTSTTAVTVNVSFGGSLGYGTDENYGAIQTTSSGDKTVDRDDAWVLAANSRETDGPIGVVLGSTGTLQGTGNQQQNPFTTPMATSGNDANFYGFIHRLTIEPGETRSLARFVLAGEAGEEGTEGAVEALKQLAEQPDFNRMTPEQICTLGNWDLTKLTDFDTAACAEVARLDIPAAPEQPEMVTSSPYDVVNKTIAEMQSDMEKGITTSEEITRAYLDRIAAYDKGQLGFHAFLQVADNAIEQAKAADEARKNGQTGGLLGIPIAIKDIYDTKDMPTTGGSRALEGWQPGTDAYQVQKLREAGAIIIGKANTSEFANSGSFSESGWMQTWNALYPSKTSFGSSGGSAVAVAASMSSAAMGSQTGVSLYAPSVGASLTTFRGTDGMASVHGVMPLTWGQDYAGPIARTVTDLAYILNVTTGTDPLDPLTKDADAFRPDDWTDSLDPNALQGKRIGYIPDAFVSTFADDGTGEAVMKRFADLEAAGATIVEMSAPPSGGNRPSGNANVEGWARYIELHEDFPYATGDELLASPDVLLYNQRNNQERPRMTEEEVNAWLEYRADYKKIIEEWMEEHDVDSVVYPGFISDVYNNDSAAAQLSSDRATGVLTSNVGLPTVVVPVGVSPNGYSLSMQLVGKAWDDASILGMGYALEQQTKARIITKFAPKLAFKPAPVEFGDIAGHWAEEKIETLTSKGLISGYPDGSFRPDAAITRSEAAKVLAIQLGLELQESSFSDVSSAYWADGFIGAVEQAGIITGYGDGMFKPDDRLSREEMAALTVRAFSLQGDGAVSFPDVGEASWSYSYIATLAATGIISGYEDGAFKPANDITRAEFASIMTNVLHVLSNE